MKEDLLNINGWNYRVAYKVETISGNEYAIYGIHEVYYDKEGNPIMITEDSMAPGGESVEELKEDLSWMMKAFDKPPLNWNLVGQK